MGTGCIIKNKKVVIIFLYGEDVFRSHRKLIEIKDKYLASDKSGSGLSVFDCEDDKDCIGKIKNIISTPNLLAPKRLIIIKRLIESFSDSQQKEMLEYLKKAGKKLLEDKDAVVVFWENKNPKKNNALFKLLSQKTRSQDFKKLDGIKLRQWIVKFLEEINAKPKISKPALEKLIIYCGEDTFLLSNEIEKLSDFAGEKMISEADVELLVHANLNGNIFQMVDAIGANNKKEALKLLHIHLEKGDDPFYLLSMFFYQFRNMLKVVDFRERGVYSEYEISRLAKLHPFVVKKSMSQTARFTLEKLKQIYQRLSQLDTEIKTGKIEIKLGLDKFIAEL